MIKGISNSHTRTRPLRSNTATWMVSYANHDMGSPGGNMLRKTKVDALRSKRLLRQCGYLEVTVKQWTK